MTGWLIVLGVCVVFLVISIVMQIRSDDYLSGWIFGIIFGGLFVLNFAGLVIFTPYSVRTQTGQFQSQKTYIQNHVSKGQYDDVAITQKKIEMNQWLFTAQQCNLVYGMFTFYPDSIQDLEPIQ